LWSERLGSFLKPAEKNECEVTMDKATNYLKLFNGRLQLPHRQLAASRPWLQWLVPVLGMRASPLGINMTGFLLIPPTSCLPLAKTRFYNLPVDTHILGAASDHPARTSSLAPENGRR
jgi:hypothetical protein